MKKIGILTYHSSINEGAMLQAYALQKVLKNHFSGQNVVVDMVDYQSKSANHRDFVNCRSKNIKILIKRLRRFLRLKKWQKKNFDLSSQQYIGDDFELSQKFVREENYDVLIVGSDEIWKVFEKNNLRGFPNMYWLAGDLGAKKLSYAASAHKTQLKKLSAEKKDKMKEILSDFTHIAVRDEITFDMVKELLPQKEIFRVLDPTFLYPFDNTPLPNLFKKLPKKYAVVNIENKEMSSIVVPFLKSKGFFTVSVSNYNAFVDCNLLDKLNPLEWVSIYKAASFSVTDRFHGSIFSIKNTLPFLSINHAKTHDNGESKMKDLLQRFDLDVDCFIDTNDKNFEEKKSMLLSKLESLIDYKYSEETKKSIDRQIKASKEYLRQIDGLL